MGDGEGRREVKRSKANEDCEGVCRDKNINEKQMWEVAQGEDRRGRGVHT